MVERFVMQTVCTWLFFTTLVRVKGDDIKPECDLHLVSACYWRIADRFGMTPFLHIPEDPKGYLKDFCQNDKTIDELPAQPDCKEFYANCSKEEKEMFARMERGYTTLRRATSASKECESVTLLRDCFNFDEIRSCRRRLPDVEAGTFQMQAQAQQRGAQGSKACLLTAANPCRNSDKAPGVAHLQKIVDATIDLTFFPVSTGVASCAKAAILAIAGSLIISLAATVA